MIRFYAPDIVEIPELPETESGHCVKVLRHRTGDTVEVTDGKGWIYECRIADANPKKVSLEISGRRCESNPWKGKIVIGVAPTKNVDRMEWLIEKLVETGVDVIVPVVCEHSERRVMKPDRPEKIIVAAMKQSLKAVKPVLEECMSLKLFLKSYSTMAQKFIAYCDEAVGKSYLCNIMTPGADTAILIGPEGDFSPDEVKEAMDAGFVPVSLGPCRLRTETAALEAVMACHILQNIESKNR